MWLLAETCFLCGARSSEALCPACRAELPWHDGPACPRCARPLPLPSTPLREREEPLAERSRSQPPSPLRERLLCGSCLADPPPQWQTQAAFIYTYPLDRLILAGKYHHDLALLAWLGRAMAGRLRIAEPPDVIIPVPLHDAGLRKRGYNQALELAKVVARQRRLPLAYDACRCVGKQHDQASLPAKERHRNVRGVYRIHRLEAHWQRVAVLDDVMTTGATVEELARTLLRAGVESVEVWCCARNTLN
jgi:ComF family protein